MTTPALETTPSPAKIHIDNDGELILVTIRNATGEATAYITPPEAYSIAQYVEWINDDSRDRRDEPTTVPCPPDMGVWGELDYTRSNVDPDIRTHIVVLGEYADDAAMAICLAKESARELHRGLIYHAVALTTPED